MTRAGIARRVAEATGRRIASAAGLARETAIVVVVAVVVASARGAGPRSVARAIGSNARDAGRWRGGGDAREARGRVGDARTRRGTPQIRRTLPGGRGRRQICARGVGRRGGTRLEARGAPVGPKTRFACPVQTQSRIFTDRPSPWEGIGQGTMTRMALRRRRRVCAKLRFNSGCSRTSPAMHIDTLVLPLLYCSGLPSIEFPRSAIPASTLRFAFCHRSVL